MIDAKLYAAHNASKTKEIGVIAFDADEAKRLAEQRLRKGSKVSVSGRRDVKVGKSTRAVYPNKGVETKYRQELYKLVDEMANSIEYWIEAAYKNNTPDMAMDALPSQVLAKRLQEVGKRWIKRFDDMAATIAERFIQSGKKATDSSMQQSFKDAGWTVQFKPTKAIRDAMNASVVENVKLISNLPQQYMTNVQGIVMRGYTNGRDLKYISDELQKQYGITKRRAAFIARDQSNKLTATVTQARRIELGLFEAEWIHSKGGKHPRASHVKAGQERHRFDVRIGAAIDGEYIQPGYLPNCHPAESEVEIAHGCMKLYRRRYSGELLTFVFHDGVVLKATPNHPILTSNGWKAAKDINLGDDIVERSYKGLNIPEANIQDAVSRFDEFFDATARMVGMTNTQGGYSGFEFHGDISDGEINIVDIASFLGDDIKASGNEQLLEFILSAADVAFNGLLCDRASDEFVVCSLLSTDSRVSSFSTFLSKLRAESSRANKIGFARPSDLDALFLESTSDNYAINPVFFREFKLAKSGDVTACNQFIGKLLALLAIFSKGDSKTISADSLAERARMDSKLSSNILEILDPIKHCKRVADKFVSEDFSHYVYNLETVNNWYIVNGIVTHNCRCVSRTILPF